MDDGVSWNFDGRSTDGKRYRFVPGVSGLHRHRLPCLVTFAFHPQNLPRSISPFFPFPIPHPPIPSIVCSFFFLPSLTYPTCPASNSDSSFRTAFARSRASSTPRTSAGQRCPSVPLPSFGTPLPVHFDSHPPFPSTSGILPGPDPPLAPPCFPIFAPTLFALLPFASGPAIAFTYANRTLQKKGEKGGKNTPPRARFLSHPHNTNLHLGSFDVLAPIATEFAGVSGRYCVPRSPTCNADNVANWQDVHGNSGQPFKDEPTSHPSSSLGRRRPSILPCHHF